MSGNLLTPEERIELGRQRRQMAPRSSHAEWSAAPGRPDPLDLLVGQEATRLPWLLPVRHARMAASPFAFFRGAAVVMASDLANTPDSGIVVQAGGDAHMSNFGAYASPERWLVFDQNDFDETLPGPWEWDVKRLAASLAIAGRHLGFTKRQRRTVLGAAMTAYRDAMIHFSDQGYLELWYDHVAADDVESVVGVDHEELRMRIDRFRRKAQRRTSLQALDKLTEQVDGRRRIRSDPPLLEPLRDVPVLHRPGELEEATVEGFRTYTESLPDHLRVLVERYWIVDIGLKVVGVGSVGTRCLIVLLEGRDEGDPLFLQIKEANASVLEAHVGASAYDNHGRRVVEGQRLVQAQSDIFLGWTRGPSGIDFYVRQLRDWKGSVEVEGSTPNQLAFYAGLCGVTLARGHARSGDAAAIRGYIGRGDAFERAISGFAEAYADQNQADYERFHAAIGDGRLEVAETV